MSIMWGYGWVALKVGLMDAEPFTFTAVRVTLSAACLLLLLRLGGRSLVPGRVPELIKLGLVQTTALFTLSTWAVAQGSAGRVAFLTYTMPFFTLLFAWPLLGEKVRGFQWLANRTRRGRFSRHRSAVASLWQHVKQRSGDWRWHDVGPRSNHGQAVTKSCADGFDLNDCVANAVWLNSFSHFRPRRARGPNCLVVAIYFRIVFGVGRDNRRWLAIVGLRAGQFAGRDRKPRDSCRTGYRDAQFSVSFGRATE